MDEVKENFDENDFEERIENNEKKEEAMSKLSFSDMRSRLEKRSDEAIQHSDKIYDEATKSQMMEIAGLLGKLISDTEDDFWQVSKLCDDTDRYDEDKLDSIQSQIQTVEWGIEFIKGVLLINEDSTEEKFWRMIRIHEYRMIQTVGSINSDIKGIIMDDEDLD